MMDAQEKAKNWLDINGIEATEHRIKTLSKLLEEAWQDGWRRGHNGY